MKFHRVLLFTTIQMDITPVGDDLHILLTGGDQHRIGCTAWSVPQPPDTDTPAEPQPDVPEKTTGQRTLCTGGVYVDNPDEHQLAKLYENIDEMIRDWANFLTD